MVYITLWFFVSCVLGVALNVLCMYIAESNNEREDATAGVLGALLTIAAVMVTPAVTYTAAQFVDSPVAVFGVVLGTLANLYCWTSAITTAGLVSEDDSLL